VSQVVAIGLDAADPALIEEWLDQGYLPNLNRLRQQGAYGRLANLEYYKAETAWTTFLTGCQPQRTGYWTPIQYHPQTYSVVEGGAYDYRQYPPFYAFAPGKRVAVFDMPQTVLDPRVDGLQVLAWGAHSPQTPSHSLPPEVLPALIARHGGHPALHKDHGDWYDQAYLTRLQAALHEGVRLRTAICRELLQQPWDLFLTVFSETHSAGHDLWYLSQPDHPLYDPQATTSPLRQVYEDVDRAIGQLLADVPAETAVVVFSTHGSGPNNTDVPSMILLPELLYRFSFAGQSRLSTASGRKPSLLRPPMGRGDWSQRVHRLSDKNPLKRLLKQAIPGRLHRRLGWKPPMGPLAWQPTTWYQPDWPRMKAFALPSFSEGYIRINLQGREPHGIITPDGYNTLCDELTTLLYQLQDGRTGQPMVKKVLRTRSGPQDDSLNLPDADLVVVWQDEPTDLLESPLGRIGPVPYRRTGSHRPEGFIFARTPQTLPGSALQGHVVDLAATLLELMGSELPAHLEGRPLVGIATVLSDPKTIAAPI